MHISKVGRILSDNGLTTHSYYELQAITARLSIDSTEKDVLIAYGKEYQYLYKVCYLDPHQARQEQHTDRFAMGTPSVDHAGKEGDL